MRERLISMIQDSVNGCARHWAEVIADYLLENGVIVLPIQLGQRVWFLQGNTDEVCEATVIRVEYNYFTSPQEWIEIEYYSPIIGEHKYKSRIDLMLGKAVFLTREAAEKALKEREKT